MVLKGPVEKFRSSYHPLSLVSLFCLGPKAISKTSTFVRSSTVVFPCLKSPTASTGHYVLRKPVFTLRKGEAGGICPRGVVERVLVFPLFQLGSSPTLAAFLSRRPSDTTCPDCRQTGPPICEDTYLAPPPPPKTCTPELKEIFQISRKWIVPHFLFARTASDGVNASFLN